MKYKKNFERVALQPFQNFLCVLAKHKVLYGNLNIRKSMEHSAFYLLSELGKKNHTLYRAK
ncbi:MAG: hypothetical protein DCF19_09395 [Pseudanabaena frigida]|uniref:Uncharacterized protein n=1 Tax=Pseudanabaena frigida TaxID=945775 RepID=A0A2W4WA73_9CYAN|nr:MAG: hypothetical protein DCF19_09395 [Pseudanabaena frigida]